MIFLKETLRHRLNEITISYFLSHTLPNHKSFLLKFGGGEVGGGGGDIYESVNLHKTQYSILDY